MTELSDQSPRQQRRQGVGMAEAGMHTLPGAAPSAGTDDDSQGMTEGTRGQLATVAHRFIHDPQAVIGLVLFFGMAIAAILTGLFWTYSYTTITNTLNAPPSLSHPFGTNTIGGDMFAQVMRGTLQDIEIALLVAVMATVLGALVGAIAGFYGGRVDSSLMRFVDLILVIPVLVILILLANIVAKQADNWFWLAIIIGAVSWTYIARLVRADFLTLREREFVEASRALGASDSRLILRHMLPNALGPIIVNATITVALAISLESTLSFLGLGIQPPNISLGLLIDQGQDSATTEWWLFVFPVVFLMVLILSVFFIGDGLREAFDPKKNRVRA
ncbi:MAG: ABC transporter permease [Acidimicrobiales bacterium]|jgi:peptide/nickel transport system permease protein